jgi:hypothetical protein
MDFSNRSPQSPQAAAPSTHPAPEPSPVKRNNKSSDDSKWGKIGIVAACGAVLVLLIALVVFIGFSDTTNSKEAGYVDDTKLQAVFLNTGQVYFGNIQKLNNQYLVLTNIYYLQTASNNSSSSTPSSSSNTSVSLVKLGCELHEPFDRMVINHTQVTFWENLQDGGQVAKAVSAFEKQNPNGQKCSDQSSSASTNSVNSTQNAGSSTTNSSTGQTKP